MKKLFTALAETLEQAGEYLLCEDGISLAPDKIFVDAAEREFLFCYMPFEKMDFAEELRCLMDYYISHMYHGGSADTKKCYDVYEKCQQEHVAMEELLQLLFEEEEGETELRMQEPSLQEPAVKKEDTGESLIQEIPQKIRNMRLQNKRIRGNFFDRETWKDKIFSGKRKRIPQESYVFEPETYQAERQNPTVFLGTETRQILGELRYEGDGKEQNLKITEPVFLIGSRREEADGFISDDTVSRIHARITIEDDAYYLEDMNSTNGTSRNGEPLQYKEKVKLEKNDRIAFANERYRFV